MKAHTRRFLVYLICFLSVGFNAQCLAHQINPSVSIGNALSPLANLAASDPAGEKALKAILEARLINNHILPYFYEVPGALHEITPERQLRILDTEKALAPYADILVGVLERTKDWRNAPNPAAQLLAFAPASPGLKAKLQALIANPAASPQMTGEVYNVIFMLELDDEALRREVVSKIALRDQPTIQSALGGYLLEAATTRWALPEIAEVLKTFLSVPLQPENYPAQGGRQKLVSNYQLAADGLARFGILASHDLELLKARLRELNPNEASEVNAIARLKDCIARIEGRYPPELAINRKGQLLGVCKEAYPKWLAQHSAPNVVRQPVPLANGAERNEEAARVVPSSATNRDISLAPKVNSWWPWAVGGGLLLALVVLLFRKSKGNQ